MNRLDYSIQMAHWAADLPDLSNDSVQAHDESSSEYRRLRQMADYLQGKEVDWPLESAPIAITGPLGGTLRGCQTCGRLHCVCEELEGI